jgi:cyclohexa-1,5-dienecarbonyl-CoA hydratase
MATTFESLRVESTDGVGRIRLARPPLNILNLAMVAELHEALLALAADQHLKAVVLEAEGKAFCAGVDVADHLPDRVERMITSFDQLVSALRALPVPTVAAVRGAALGGGMELVLGCDIVLAGSSARFGQSEIKLAVFPPIAAALLPSLVGSQQAARLILTGETIAADEAARIGLVTEVVADDALADALDTLLNQLRAQSAAVLRIAKRALLTSRDGDAIASLRSLEDLYLRDLMRTADSAEGLRAFMEKRQPVWRDA